MGAAQADGLQLPTPGELNFALAALLAGRPDVRGLRVGVTLSGGNITGERLGGLLGAPR
jgi:threonine dehydratase